VSNSNMSQSVREFVRRSGVELQSPNSASNSNNNFARELERDVAMIQERKARENRIAQGQRFFRSPPRQVQFPKKLENSLVNNKTYSRFREFENNSPLANEFDDVVLNSNNEKMIQNILNEQGNNDNFLKDDDFTKEFGITSPHTGLQISKLNPGMFNALVNKEFGQTPRLDLKSILLKRPLAKSPVGEGLYIDTTEIRGVYGQFKQGFSHTKESGPQGDLNKNYNQVQIKLQVTNNVETKGATVSLFRNGKIRFSGGFVGTNIANQPELIRRFVVEKYTDKQPFLYSDFEYNNLSGQFRINGVFKNMASISMRARQYGMTEASYEPEITPFLYIESPEHKYIITRNGNVQISGAKSPRDMERAYTFGSEFVRRLDQSGEIQVTGEFSTNLRAEPKPKAKAKAKAKTKVVKAKTKLSKNQLNALMVDTKMCRRMKLTELKDFARTLGVVNFRTRTNQGSREATKDEICNMIKKKQGIKTVTYKNTNKGKNVSLSGTNARFKVGKVLCKNLKVKELLRIAGVMKIPLTGKEKKADLCKLIEKARNNINAKPVVSPRAAKQKTKNNKKAAKELSKNINRQLKINDAEMKRRLNNNSIRNDLNKLYGSKWMNRYKPNLTQDIKVVQNKIRNIKKTNKLGVPFKRDVDALKKKLVEQWKRERVRNLEKNLINVTGVAFNLRDSYRRAAINYVMNLQSNKKRATAKRMQDFKKNWLKFRNNVNTNVRARGINRAVRARVETL
jgi:TATA-box binding protein (TBP) (component of TFIID and TFIIIB)